MENPESNPLEGYSVRFAKPEESSDFTKWATENDKIPQKDILATDSSRNPTVVHLVIEKDGKVILYAPVYCQMNLAFLGFNPESKGRERLLGLKALQVAAAGFAVMHGVEEITVQTSKDYPVGQWALKHGFEIEPRQTFKVRASDILRQVEEELVPCV